MIRGLAKTEPEILLIAVFICSNYGKEIITRAQAVKLYQDNGFYSSTRTKGFSNFLTSIIRSQYLRNVADGQYSVTSEGIEKAKEILAGKSTTVAKKISTKPKSKQPKKESKT